MRIVKMSLNTTKRLRIWGPTSRVKAKSNRPQRSPAPSKCNECCGQWFHWSLTNRGYARVHCDSRPPRFLAASFTGRCRSCVIRFLVCRTKDFDRAIKSPETTPDLGKRKRFDG